MEESFIILFIWISLSIRRLEILPVMNQDEIVHESQFDTLYYVPIQLKAFNKLIPNIRSEFGEEILFRSSGLLYVFHFRPKSI